MTPERLRELYGEVHQRAAAKVIASFDRHCRQFIEHATFLVLATSDGQNLDVSPKGDPAGFVTVESDTTLLLPDRPGNNRIDSLLNILAHPKVALLFLIPTVDETLRVNGTAEISDDPALCDQFKVNGGAPRRCCVSRQRKFIPIVARRQCEAASGSPKAGHQIARLRHCLTCSEIILRFRTKEPVRMRSKKCIATRCTRRSGKKEMGPRLRCGPCFFECVA